MMMIRETGVAGLMLLLAACTEPAATIPQRDHDAQRLERGRAVFRQHCARCHGQDAQGADNWRVRNPDGTFPPPPLNGTGHAWHHPLENLQLTIRQGTVTQGGNMPAWQGVLSEQEIGDVVFWFQSLWSEEAYVAWWEIDQRWQRGMR